MIVRKRISDQVIDEIKSKIQSGEFPIDSKLPSENELAKMFNVSRVPIREALSALSSHGIIESIHGGGSWVRPKPFEKLIDQSLIEVISFKQIIELLEMRTILETKAAFLAAQRHDDNDLQKMQQAQDLLCQEFDQTNNMNDEPEFLFHQSIVHATKNEVLISTLENLFDLYNRALKASLPTSSKIEGSNKQIYEEHQIILKAILLRDAEGAEAAMLKHLSNNLTTLQARYAEFNEKLIE
ncbi:FadR/GntR family transcriptional regulator [Solibacillus sp. FSL K6-1523]|uniref:FadR/GntR family transcriptional regulator n=1 Tax=Solibacillus sp. FSL K6-1523 TaxID=2921471 RepID=UPI0030F6DC92